MEISKLEKKKMEIKEIINEIAPERVDRVMFLLEYMATSSMEEGEKLAAYSKKDGVTLDMAVEWVKNRQLASLIEVAI